MKTLFEMNSLLSCCIFFVGFSVLLYTVVLSEELHKSEELPRVPQHVSHFFIGHKDTLNYMLNVNDEIQDFLLCECNKLRVSMEKITILGKSIHFLALDDNEMLQLQSLHSYLMHTNGICDDLHDQMLHFADGRYDQYLASVPLILSADQILRLGSPSRLDWAVAVTEEKLATIKSFFAKNETKTAMKLTELKKLKISTEIIKLSSSIKEIELGIEPLLGITKIENDFLKNLQEMASDLEKHVEEVLKLDDLMDAINKSIESIVNAQKGIPLEMALSFIA